MEDLGDRGVLTDSCKQQLPGLIWDGNLRKSTKKTLIHTEEQIFLVTADLFLEQHAWLVNCKLYLEKSIYHSLPFSSIKSLRFGVNSQLVRISHNSDLSWKPASNTTCFSSDTHNLASMDCMCIVAVFTARLSTTQRAVCPENVRLILLCGFIQTHWLLFFLATDVSIKKAPKHPNLCHLPYLQAGSAPHNALHSHLDWTWWVSGERREWKETAFTAMDLLKISSVKIYLFEGKYVTVQRIYFLCVGWKSQHHHGEGQKIPELGG